MEFTSVLDNGKKQQCGLYCSVLSNEAMKPSKLKCQQKHLEQELDFFQRQKLLFKRQKLDASGHFQEQSTAGLIASFKMALHIAKQKSPIPSEKLL